MGLKASLLSVVRRGPMEVVWTPDFMGLGNLLYVALWAWSGNSRRMLSTLKLEPWLVEFPHLRRVVIDRSDVPFTALRRSATGHSYGRFGDDFSPSQLTEFIRQALLPSAALSNLPTTDPDTVVINVRRGDYYSVPAFRGSFAFDIDAYLRVAVADVLSRTGPIGRLVVVSDGLDWCRARLGWLSDHCQRLEFGTDGEGALADLRTVVSAPRLVITNSTFSYWAGYIRGALGGHVRNESLWAPAFFDRTQAGGERGS